MKGSANNHSVVTAVAAVSVSMLALAFEVRSMSQSEVCCVEYLRGTVAAGGSVETWEESCCVLGSLGNSMVSRDSGSVRRAFAALAL